MIKKLKKEFSIDFRKDAYLTNNIGLSPIMDYDRAKEIVTKANILAKENGLERIYNLNMEVEKLRTQSLKSYLSNLKSELEDRDK